MVRSDNAAEPSVHLDEGREVVLRELAHVVGPGRRGHDRLPVWGHHLARPA